MMASNDDVSLGNILDTFPEFVMLLLPYIADRTVFNSIASCNRDTHKKSKALVPPWPTDYQLPASDDSSDAVWSPDGTRVAYACRSYKTITIVDQRYGLIRRINHNRGMAFCDFKFSPDGRFLVSADEDHIVKLWDNNADENYEQLQEWNEIEDFDEIGMYSCSIDISAWSKYIVVASYTSNRVVIKRVENGETIRSLTPQPVMNIIFEVIFSVDYRAVFIYGRCENSHSRVIKLWRPYLEDTDENRLITLWEQEQHHNYAIKIIVSHDTTMIAIQDPFYNKGWLLSIDNNYSCTVQEFNIQGSIELLQFTPNDECIICATENELKYWSVAERKFMDNDCVFYNEKTMHHLNVMNCSPNTRQFIVRAINKKRDESSSLYMKSFSLRKKSE